MLTEQDYEDIFQYLLTRKYRPDCSKNQRRIIRRRAKEHFKLKNGRLFYSSGKTRAGSKWRLVIKEMNERKRILASCHSGTGSKCARFHIY